LVLPELKIKGAEACCSSVTIQEEPPSAAFPVPNGGEPINKILGNHVFLFFWLVLPESKIKGAEVCCSSVTIHEAAFLAAFPVLIGGEPDNKILEITCRYAHPLGGHFPAEGRTGNPQGSRRFLYKKVAV